MEREAKKSASDINGLTSPSDRSIGKVIFPLKLVGQRCPPTHCMANVSPLPVHRSDPGVTAAQNLDPDDRFDDKMVISPLFSCSRNFVTGC